MLHPKADEEVQTPLQYMGLHGTGESSLYDKIPKVLRKSLEIFRPSLFFG